MYKYSVCDCNRKKIFTSLRKGESVSYIADKLCISRMTLYRYLKKNKRAFTRSNSLHNED